MEIGRKHGIFAASEVLVLAWPAHADFAAICSPLAKTSSHRKQKMTAIREFFARYEEGANSFDPDLVCSQYTAEFMGGDPNGVVCGKNDENLRDAIAKRHSFFREIGFRSAKVLDVAETSLDEHYTMAKVYWNMVFEKQPGRPLDFKFYITYFLFNSGSGPKVAFWVSHDDERKVMQEAGLVPPDGGTSG